jgi:hypothetical protein
VLLGLGRAARADTTEVWVSDVDGLVTEATTAPQPPATEKVVHLAPGTYGLSQPIDVLPNIHLIGDANALTPDGNGVPVATATTSVVIDATTPRWVPNAAWSGKGAINIGQNNSLVGLTVKITGAIPVGGTSSDALGAAVSVQNLTDPTVGFDVTVSNCIFLGGPFPLGDLRNDGRRGLQLGSGVGAGRNLTHHAAIDHVVASGFYGAGTDHNGRGFNGFGLQLLNAADGSTWDVTIDHTRSTGNRIGFMGFTTSANSTTNHVLSTRNNWENCQAGVFVQGGRDPGPGTGANSSSLTFDSTSDSITNNVGNLIAGGLGGGVVAVGGYRNHLSATDTSASISSGNTVNVSLVGDHFAGNFQGAGKLDVSAYGAFSVTGAPLGSNNLAEVSISNADAVAPTVKLVDSQIAAVPSSPDTQGNVATMLVSNVGFTRNGTFVCSVNADCTNGKVCVNQACSPCTSNSQCSSGQACINGQCVADAPSLSLQLTVSTNGACPGSNAVTVASGTSVTECYAVTNTGDTTIDSISVSGTNLQLGALAPGQSTTASATATASTTTTVSASVTGTDVVGGAAVTSPPGSANINVDHPSLSLQLTLSTNGTCPGTSAVTVGSGTSVTECYAVTNNGDSAINNVAVSGTSLQLGALAPGQTATTSATVTASTTTTVSASATGTDVATGAAVTSPPGSANLNVDHPSLALQLTLSSNGTCPGSNAVTVVSGTSVTECYTVTNTGDSAINDVSVSGINQNLGALAPGQATTTSATVTASATTTVSASATGTDAATGAAVTSPSASATLTINHPPTITCPGADNANCSSPQGASQTLIVNLSDADNDALTVTWNVDGTDVVVNNDPSGVTSDSFGTTYAVGTHTVTVTASDGMGGVASCSTTVTVADHFSLAGALSAASLWPPNHDLVSVGYSIASSDPCASNPSISVAVYSNEPDLGADFDNQFSPDATGFASGQLRLRSERSESSQGRVYLIVATGTDQFGNHSTDCRTVVVSHDQSRASVSAIQKQAADALATCRTGALPPGFVAVGGGPVVGSKQ